MLWRPIPLISCAIILLVRGETDTAVKKPQVVGRFRETRDMLLHPPLSSSSDPSSSHSKNLPHPSKWNNRPIFLSADDRVKVKNYGAGPMESLPLNKPIAFETELFVGSFFLRLKNVKPEIGDPNAKKHTSYFGGGRKRLYQLVIQGRFKDSKLTFADIVIGDVYKRPLKGVPTGKLGYLIKRFVEGVSPGIIFDIFDSKKPKVLAPMGGCQTLSVDLPGEEPTDFDDLEENTSLLGKFRSKEDRKKILSKLKTAEGYRIDPNHVYTLEIYDDMMDFGEFRQKVMVSMV